MHRDWAQRKLIIVMFHHIIHHIFSLRHRLQISSWPTQLRKGWRREWLTGEGRRDRLPRHGMSGSQLWKRGRGGWRGQNSRGSKRFNTLLGVTEEDCSNDELLPNISCMMSHTSTPSSLHWNLVSPLEGKTRYQKTTSACFLLSYRRLDIRHGTF